MKTTYIEQDIPDTDPVPTPDESEALGKLWLAGDTTAREELIVAHRGLVARSVRAMLRRYRNGLFGLTDGGDLFSAGCVGLAKGVDGLKNTENVQGYLARSIKRAIKDEIEEYARHPMLPVSDWAEKTWEYSPSPSENQIEDAIREAAKGELDEEACRELLRMRRRRCTFAEIEKEIGIKPSTASDRCRRMERKLANRDAAARKSGDDAPLIPSSEAITQQEETDMDIVLKAFIERSTHQRPEARLKLTDLMGKFRSTLDGRELRLWPRWRFVKELKEGGYTLGKDSDRVVFVVGLSFQAPRQWTVDDAGRLRLETAASPARRTDAVADAVAVPARVLDVAHACCMDTAVSAS